MFKATYLPGLLIGWFDRKVFPFYSDFALSEEEEYKSTTMLTYQPIYIHIFGGQNI